jgi:hypothetical protein
MWEITAELPEAPRRGEGIFLNRSSMSGAAFPDDGEERDLWIVQDVWWDPFETDEGYPEPVSIGLRTFD